MPRADNLGVQAARPYEAAGQEVYECTHCAFALAIDTPTICQSHVVALGHCQGLLDQASTSDNDRRACRLRSPIAFRRVPLHLQLLDEVDLSAMLALAHMAARIDRLLERQEPWRWLYPIARERQQDNVASLPNKCRNGLQMMECRLGAKM
jgi:hypothetical protein